MYGFLEYEKAHMQGYQKFVDEQIMRAFGVPARYFDTKQVKTVANNLENIIQKDKNMTKYVIEWFIDGDWKSKYSDPSSSLGSAMCRNSDILWSNGPDNQKYGIDSDGYLYRIVEKKPQWTSWRRSPNELEWKEVSGHDSLTEGTSKLSRSGFTIIWASVTDSNQCFGVDRNGNAFKIERTK